MSFFEGDCTSKQTSFSPSSFNLHSLYCFLPSLETLFQISAESCQRNHIIAQYTFSIIDCISKPSDFPSNFTTDVSLVTDFISVVLHFIFYFYHPRFSNHYREKERGQFHFICENQLTLWTLQLFFQFIHLPHIVQLYCRFISKYLWHPLVDVHVHVWFAITTGILCNLILLLQHHITSIF